MIDEKKNYLMLDIDGVISVEPDFYTKRRLPAPYGDCYPFNKKCIKILNEIIEETDCEIVLTSDWRLFLNLKEANDVFKLNNVIKSPIGYTKSLYDIFADSRNLAQIRVMEISDFIVKNNIKHFAVVDDLVMLPSPFEERFIHCGRIREGIKQSGLKEKIIKTLKK